MLKEERKKYELMNEERGTSDKRGYHAEKPSQIPRPGWKDIGLRVKDELVKDNISIVSAGVAYYFFLALFPALIATISIYGFVMEPGEAEKQVNQIAQMLPEEASDMIADILKDIAGKTEETLGWSMILSILFSLWSAQKGTNAVFEGVNIAYNEIDERGFFKRNGITLLFTLAGIIIGIMCTALVVVFPAVIDNFALPYYLQTIIQWLRWPLMAVIIMGALGCVYKYAPDRRNPEFRWVSRGAVLATLLWLTGSLLFAFYINNFGNYDKVYGSFTAVIILMLWFFITAYIILLGAEINSEMEHQTKKDSTIGEDKPMGQREAYHADHVADRNRDD